ncbi:hypothetical protein EBS80_04360 [bacterium]|nr:hypothetical protein [bacterium]
MTKKKTPAKKMTVTRRRPAASMRMEVVSSPMPEPMPGPQATDKARVVYFAGCRNCNHLPMSVNAVMAVLIAIIFTLSAMLMATSVTTASSAAGIAAVASR